MKEATDNLIHPVRPGNVVELGDYGYFENGLWCRMGNIAKIKGYRCSLHINNNSIRQEHVFNYGVSFNTVVNAEAAASGNGIVSTMKFSHSNSFFIRAFVEKIDEYDSVDVELLDQIKRLDAAGKWRSDYCVVVSVLYSPRFIAAFSSSKAKDLGLTASVDKDMPLDSIGTSVSIVSGANKSGVDFVNCLNGTDLSAIGFKTVTWTRSLRGLGKKVIKFVGDDEVPEYEPDREADNDSEPTVYNNMA